MPTPGTLAALKSIFSARRTVAVNTILTAADIGRLILVNTTAGNVTVTLPRISGQALPLPAQSGVGVGGTIVLVKTAEANDLIVATPAGTPDTFNGGQAFVATTGIPTAAGPGGVSLNAFIICVSPGGAGIQDWALLASLPGTL